MTPPTIDSTPHCRLPPIASSGPQPPPPSARSKRSARPPSRRPAARAATPISACSSTSSAACPVQPALRRGARREDRRRAGAAQRVTRNSTWTDWQSLSLVEDDAVEELVSADRLGQAIALECEWELRELSTYIGALLKSGHAERDGNPLRPEIIGKALSRAIEEVTPERDRRALLARELGRGLSAVDEGVLRRHHCRPAAARRRAVGLTVKTVVGPGHDCRARPCANRPTDLVAARSSGQEARPGRRHARPAVSSRAVDGAPDSRRDSRAELRPRSGAGSPQRRGLAARTGARGTAPPRHAARQCRAADDDADSAGCASRRPARATAPRRSAARSPRWSRRSAGRGGVSDFAPRRIAADGGEPDPRPPRRAAARPRPARSTTW